MMALPLETAADEPRLMLAERNPFIRAGVAVKKGNKKEQIHVWQAAVVSA
jgi:hypothetical protein